MATNQEKSLSVVAPQSHSQIPLPQLYNSAPWFQIAPVSALNQIDPLSNLLALPGVAKECEVTLKAIDELLWNRTVRRHQSALSPYTRRIAGFATAALDGAQMPKDPTMEPEVSPMGSLSEQGLLVTAEADLQTLAFKTEPLKVLARLHTFASNDW